MTPGELTELIIAALDPFLPNEERLAMLAQVREACATRAANVAEEKRIALLQKLALERVQLIACRKTPPKLQRGLVSASEHGKTPLAGEEQRG